MCLFPFISTGNKQEQIPKLLICVMLLEEIENKCKGWLQSHKHAKRVATNAWYSRPSSGHPKGVHLELRGCLYQNSLGFKHSGFVEGLQHPPARRYLRFFCPTRSSSPALGETPSWTHVQTQHAPVQLVQSILNTTKAACTIHPPQISGTHPCCKNISRRRPRNHQFLWVSPKLLVLHLSSVM